MEKKEKQSYIIAHLSIKVNAFLVTNRQENGNDSEERLRWKDTHKQTIN